MKTGSCQGSRVTSSSGIGLMDAREWSSDKDTPSSSHLVRWPCSFKGPSFAGINRNVSPSFFVNRNSIFVRFIVPGSRLDSRRLHSHGRAGVWRQHPAQLQHSYAAHHTWDWEQDEGRTQTWTSHLWGAEPQKYRKWREHSQFCSNKGKLNLLWAKLRS